MPRRGDNIHKRNDGRWEGRYKSGYKPNANTTLNIYVHPSLEFMKEQIDKVYCYK